jgi:hypothetical protein
MSKKSFLSFCLSLTVALTFFNAEKIPADKGGDKIAQQYRCPKGQHWDGRRQTCEPNQ